MNREDVINQVLSASSWQECQKARHALEEWMQKNPEDWGMLDAGSTLEMVMDGMEPPIAVAVTVSKEVSIR